MSEYNAAQYNCYKLYKLEFNFGALWQDIIGRLLKLWYLVITLVVGIYTVMIFLATMVGLLMFKTFANIISMGMTILSAHMSTYNPIIIYIPMSNSRACGGKQTKWLLTEFVIWMREAKGIHCQEDKEYEVYKQVDKEDHSPISSPLVLQQACHHWMLQQFCTWVFHLHQHNRKKRAKGIILAAMVEGNLSVIISPRYPILMHVNSLISKIKSANKITS